jgi:O-antigen/teichoic acid export membrane protein
MMNQGGSNTSKPTLASNHPWRAARLKQITSLVSRVLPKNRFARGVSVLVVGTFGAQSIMVLASPVLTRLYSPEDFGLLAVFTALLSTVAVLASLRYELAIPLPDSEEDAAALLVLSLLAVVAVSALSAIPVFLFGNEIARLCNTPALARHLYLVPLGTLFGGTYNVLNYWALRTKAFTPLAKTKVSQSLAAAGIQLGGASLGPVALLVGQVAGTASGSLSLSRHLLPRCRAAVGRVTLSSIVHTARRYKNFPFFSTPCAALNTTAAQLPALLFAVLFGAGVAGIYALAYRVLSIPMQLLGQAIGNVFLSTAAQAHRNGTLGTMVSKIHRRLAHLGMPPMLVLAIAGPEIFRLAFGPRWEQAGVFAQLLAPWLYLVFITSPLSVVFEVLERQGLATIFQGITLVVRAAAIVGGALIGDVVMAVALFALGNCACTLATLVCVVHLCGRRWRRIWRPSARALAWSIPLASPVILGTALRIDPLLWFSSLAIALLLIAARYTYLMKNAWA